MLIIIIIIIIKVIVKEVIIITITILNTLLLSFIIYRYIFMMPNVESIFEKFYDIVLIKILKRMLNLDSSLKI